LGFANPENGGEYGTFVDSYRPIGNTDTVAARGRTVIAYPERRDTIADRSAAAFR